MTEIPAYRSHIRRLRCLIRSIELDHGITVGECMGVTQACHRLHLGIGGGIPLDEENLWPGCTFHHNLQHGMGIDSFQAHYGIDLKEICRKLYRDWLAGGEPFLKPEAVGLQPEGDPANDSEDGL